MGEGECAEQQTRRVVCVGGMFSWSVRRRRRRRKRVKEQAMGYQGWGGRKGVRESERVRAELGGKEKEERKERV